MGCFRIVSSIDISVNQSVRSSIPSVLRHADIASLPAKVPVLDASCMYADPFDFYSERIKAPSSFVETSATV
ncbi:hypothetical protein C8R41DRAFT_208889 [Lentinula lateritia]|uniref:Uncharacterized protein n=1 Tax=Lentinula lateritia TaxID=40482 RepID=A0ABQ8VSK6_9AGAR|nr:hypothetical protein C8R41DRAFT_208889 [Lentinula lateritia]